MSSSSLTRAECTLAASGARGADWMRSETLRMLREYCQCRTPMSNAVILCILHFPHINVFGECTFELISCRKSWMKITIKFWEMVTWYIGYRKDNLRSLVYYFQVYALRSTRGESILPVKCAAPVMVFIRFRRARYGAGSSKLGLFSCI